MWEDFFQYPDSLSTFRSLYTHMPCLAASLALDTCCLLFTAKLAAGTRRIFTLIVQLQFHTVDMPQGWSIFCIAALPYPWAVFCAYQSVVSDSLRPTWTVACQAPLSMGILQARILGWVAMPSSRGSSQPRGQTQVSHIAGGFFTI